MIGAQLQMDSTARREFEPVSDMRARSIATDLC